jgi:subtilisin family serine protease
MVFQALGMTTATITKPALPVLGRTCGQFRRISLNSYNFVDDNFDVSDSLGHGTQMAGILSGASYIDPVYPGGPVVHRTVDRNLIHPLGLAPRSELALYKCYDQMNLQGSHIHNVIRAIEKAIDTDADLICLGLEFDLSGSVRTAITLERTIATAARKDILLVAAAGNGRQKGLSYPAACRDVLAISAVDGSLNWYTRAPYSNWADKAAQESVAFCAYGGTANEGVITTTTEFGYTTVHGTSAAAAIATGVLARILSASYLRDVRTHYDNDLAATLNQPQFQWGRSYSLPNRSPAQILTTAKRHADKRHLGPHQTHSEEFGDGLIRDA